MSVHNKSVSLFSAVLISMTCMVGSGWLFSAQLGAAQAGNWSFLSWFFAAMIMISVGLCFSVIVRQFPVRGATVRASALSHNPIFGMPFAFANWFAVVVIIATEAQATTQYLGGVLADRSNLNNILMHNGALTVDGKLFALALLIGYLMINYYGVKLLSKINNVATVFKVFVPLFAVIVFLIAAFTEKQNGSTAMTNFHLETNNEHYGFFAAIMAIVNAGLLYSFNGFQTIVSYTSEVKKPQRTIPLAIVLSVLITLGLYMLLQFAFMAAVPHDVLVAKGGWSGLNFGSPLMKLAILLGINFLVILLIADSVISPSAAGYTYMGSASRMLYAMSSERQMPGFFAQLHPVHRISRRAMWLNFILASIFLIKADSWAGLMVIVTGYNIIGYMAAPISMGAFAPQKRWMGAGIFSILSLVLLTLNPSDLRLVVLSLTLVILVYALTQSAIVSGAKIFAFILPFVGYLWFEWVIVSLFAVVTTVLITIITAIIFYWLITMPKFVNLCQRYRPENVIED